MKYLKFAILFLLIGLAGEAQAAMGGAVGSPTPVPTTSAAQPGYVNSYLGDYSTFQWEETRAQLSVGPAFLLSSANTDTRIALALRYRLSPSPWTASEDRPWRLGPLPLSLFLELGALPPNGSSLQDQTNMPDSLTTDQLTMKLDYQTHLALIDELPHGRQSWVIPEIGAGVAYAQTTVDYYSVTEGTFPDPEFPSQIDSYAYYAYGSQSRKSVGPYFSAGLHFFSDYFVSLNLQGSYIAFPYTQSFAVQQGGFQNPGAPAPAAHTTTANFPSSAWALAAILQMKLAWPTLVHTPLIPQMMPPWLMPAYTTAPISPWISSTHPTGGNVMFQYQNRWADKVEIIGEFNDWTPEPMLKDRSGMWIIVEDLPTGKFRYNYIVNGKQEIKDPWNKLVDPNSRAQGSSVVVIH